MTELDKALVIFRQDMTDPKNQSRFFDLFLNTAFHLPIVDESAEERTAAGRQDGEVMPLVITAEDKDYLMLFDSVERLHAWAESDVKCMQVPGFALAKLSQPPLHWALNVGTDYSKVFLPEEITWLREVVERCDAEAAAKAAQAAGHPVPEGGSMPSANARHILVATEAECLALKAEIEAGADFATVARANSSCPSRQQGGDLGTFSRGMMVPEFDAAVFGGEVGKVLGPVQTQFGYHLIEVTKRW